MRTLFYILVCLLTVAFSPPEGPSKTRLTYAVLRNGKVVGDINAVRFARGNQIYYEVETQISIKMLVTQNIRYTSKVTYKDGVLETAVSESFLNDRLHTKCNTSRKSNGYEIWIDGDATATLTHPILYSGVMLYFKEPSNFSHVYSEMNGIENRINKKGNGHYIMTTTKGNNQNHYFYKAGPLDRAVIENMVNLEIQRIY